MNRREATIAIASLPLWSPGLGPAAEVAEWLPEVQYPPVESLEAPSPFGLEPPTAEQKERAAQAIATTPQGPTPIAIAESFISRYSSSDPDLIAQWPKTKAWNPLVVAFFSATTTKANNDMTPWCAAFANWCMERAGRVGTRSAASQSFLRPGLFKPTKEPNEGDLAVFTCYDKKTGRPNGLGHVGFFKRRDGAENIIVVGGNQKKSGTNYYSIISGVSLPTASRDITRTIGGKPTPCIVRLNVFLSVV